MRTRQLVVAACVVAAAGAVRPAAAQGGWKFTVAPFLMGAAMDGTVTVKGHDLKVDVPFNEIVDNLHAGVMVHFDGRSDRWLVTSDLIYMNLQQSADIADGTGKATVTETLFEAGGGYRVTEALTLLAGARLVDLGQELEFTGPRASATGKVSKSWVDPFVGALLDARLADRWRLALRGDIGGFGVGSKGAWQAYADISWRASDLVSVYAGYRALDMDYESGSGSTLFRYDMLSSGPQIGVAFHF